MSRLARLRDVFLPSTEPQRAYFCTYGFDPRFFEGELLPALFPNSLALDREAGSDSAYLNAADVAFQRRDVGVFYDHLADSGEGPQLTYGSWAVNVRPAAFHAKLMLLDYGEVVRVVISSANLTASAWTRNLELFIVEDLVRGKPHQWTAGLAAFVQRLGALIPDEHTQHRRSLGTVLDGIDSENGADRVTSSWEEPLLEALFRGISAPKHLNVVTPFFEGADGDGVFDAVDRRAGGLGGDIYVATTTDYGRPQVTGPPEKLSALIESGRWTMHGVRQSWDGDEPGAPARGLHGKLLLLEHGAGARTMVGSANVTRAALLGTARHGTSAGTGNVEIVVIREETRTKARTLLPQAHRLNPDGFDIVEVAEGEDDAAVPGPETFVRSATYFGRTAELELVLAESAPELSFTYGGAAIFDGLSGRVLRATLKLRVDCFVTVAYDGATATVPFTVTDAILLLPRGTRSTIGFEEFLDVLAGERELPTRLGEDAGPRGPAGGSEADGFVGQSGPIPWRRYLAAVRGLGIELQRERQYDRGLQFVLDSPVRLKGLRDQLDAAHAAGRLTDADLAYALFELGRELTRATGDGTNPAGVERIAAATAALDKRRTEVAAGLPPGVLGQMQILEQAEL